MGEASFCIEKLTADEFFFWGIKINEQIGGVHAWFVAGTFSNVCLEPNFLTSIIGCFIGVEKELFFFNSG
jgi:hypothetical protein